MITHLQTKNCKVKNKEKVQLNKEVFITWKQPQVCLAYFKQIEKVQKELAKWNIKVSEDDIVIHVIDQMYALDRLSKATMKKW